MVKVRYPISFESKIDHRCFCRYFSNRNNYAIDWYYVVFDWCAHSQYDWKDVLFYGIAVEKANIIGRCIKWLSRIKMCGRHSTHVDSDIWYAMSSELLQSNLFTFHWILSGWRKKNAETYKNEHVCVCVGMNQSLFLT